MTEQISMQNVNISYCPTNIDDTSFAEAKNWSARVVNVGPSLAADILKNNIGNRNLRKANISRYAATMMAGNWKLSPEPIILGENHRLLNGQHRLQAVIQSGEIVPMFFVMNVSNSVFKVLDRGAPRSYADALGMDRKTVEVGRIIALLCTKDTSYVTDNDVENASLLIQDVHNEITSYCSSRAKLFSSAPFRTAATVRIFAGFDAEYVLSTYKATCLGHVAELSPLPQSVIGAALAGRVDAYGGGASKQIVNLARAWDMFDVEKQNNTRLGIKSTSRAINEIRQIVIPALSAHAKIGG